MLTVLACCSSYLALSLLARCSASRASNSSITAGGRHAAARILPTRWARSRSASRSGSFESTCCTGQRPKSRTSAINCSIRCRSASKPAWCSASRASNSSIAAGGRHAAARILPTRWARSRSASRSGSLESTCCTGQRPKSRTSAINCSLRYRSFSKVSVLRFSVRSVSRSERSSSEKRPFRRPLLIKSASAFSAFCFSFDAFLILLG